MAKDKELTVSFDKEYTTTSVDGIVTMKYSDNGLYTGSTDIPVSTLKEVANYNKEYVKAVTTEAADQAKALMSKDKSIEKVIVEFPYSVSSHGAINVGVTRSKTYPARGNSPEVTKTAINVAVKDPFARIKPTVKSLESMLTTALLG